MNKILIRKWCIQHIQRQRYSTATIFSSGYEKYEIIRISYWYEIEKENNAINIKKKNSADDTLIKSWKVKRNLL